MRFIQHVIIHAEHNMKYIYREAAVATSAVLCAATAVFSPRCSRSHNNSCLLLLVDIIIGPVGYWHYKCYFYVYMGLGLLL